MIRTFTLIVSLLFCCNTFAQNWVAKSNYTGTAKNRASGFAIQPIGKGYIVGGYDNTYQKDVYEYDAQSDTWSRKADFPGSSTVTVSFSIGGKGYTGTGVGGGYTWDNSFYEYDPQMDVWTQLRDFPGEKRAYAVGFAVGGKGYIGGGFSGNPGSFVSYNDFYSYDPVTNTWDTVAPYPGLGAALGAVGFATATKGYVGTGSSLDINGTQTMHDDFYEYDPGTDTWTQKATLPGGARGEATGAATCDRGYIGLGYIGASAHQLFTNDFWEYNPGLDKWTRIQDFGGAARAYAPGFAIDKFIYAGTGGIGTNFADFWAFNQPPVAAFTVASGSATAICIGGTVAFNDTSNFEAVAWKWDFPGGNPSSSNLQNPSVVYSSQGNFDVSLTAYSVCDSASVILTNYITVNNGPPPLNLGPDTSYCGAFTLTLDAGAGGFNYLWSTGDTNQSIVISSPGTYWVQDSTTCGISTDSITIGAGSGNFNAGTISALRDTICEGAPAGLSVTGSSGNIQWQSSLSSTGFINISGATDSSFSAPVTQTTYFRVYVKNGNCSDTSGIFQLIVHPLPVPVISAGDTLICASDSTRMDCSGSYLFYHWNNGDNRPFTYISNAGGVWVTVTDVNGCSGESNHQNILVYPVPSVSIIVQGDTLSSFGAVAYQWYRNDTLILGATSAVYTAHFSGDYSVQITDNNGCLATSTSVTVIKTGMEDISSSYEIRIYPNPVGDVLSIQGYLVNREVLYIQNVLGQIVFAKDFSGGSIDLNLSKLNAGVYWLQMSDTNEHPALKFVKR